MRRSASTWAWAPAATRTPAPSACAACCWAMPGRRGVCRDRALHRNRRARRRTGGRARRSARTAGALVARVAHPGHAEGWAVRCRALLEGIAQATSEDDRQVLQALDAALTTWQETCAQAGFADALPLPVARQAWLEIPCSSPAEPAFPGGRRHLLHAHAAACHSVRGGLPAGHERRRLPAPRAAQRLRPDGPGRPGAPLATARARATTASSCSKPCCRRGACSTWAGPAQRARQQPAAPSVLVSQLRDYLAAGWSGEVLAQRTTEHPLQPFSRRYFEGDAAALFTHARDGRAAHSAEPSAQPPAPPLPAFAPDPRVPLGVASLAAFFAQPGARLPARTAGRGVRPGAGRGRR